MQSVGPNKDLLEMNKRQCIEIQYFVQNSGSEGYTLAIAVAGLGVKYNV